MLCLRELNGLELSGAVRSRLFEEGVEGADCCWVVSGAARVSDGVGGHGVAAILTASQSGGGSVAYDCAECFC